MRSIHRTLCIVVIIAIALLISDSPSRAARTSSKNFGVYVVVGAAATLTVAGDTTFTWNGVKTTMKNYELAQSGPLTIGGGIRTSPGGGAASIVVLSPGDLNGNTKKNAWLPIEDFALTCSGNSNVGTAPAYAPPLTPLKPSSTAPCATWGAGSSATLNFTFGLYLKTHAVQKDTYSSQAFSIIATAT